MTIYRYGPIAWLWRVLAVAGLGGAALFLFLATRLGNWWLAAAIVPLGVPSALLPWMLAVRIDRTAEDEIVVTNLFFVRRRFGLSELGHPRLRRAAHGALPKVAAPRAWIPVRRALPIYLDLYAIIPDPAAFRSVFNIPRSWIR